MMRKVFALLATSVLAVTQVSSFCCDFLPEVQESGFGIGVGYRQDKIDVNYKNCFCFPDHKYKNINIWEIGIGGKYVTCNDVYFRGYADFGWITSGKRSFEWGCSCDCSCDEDFDESWNWSGSGRCNRNKIKGHVYDVSLALGYQFRWCDDSFAVSPVVGYSWHGQHLNSGKDDNNSSCYWSDYSYCDCDSSSGSSWFSNGSGNFRNRYHTRWNGPFLGLDLEYALWCDWTVFAGYEYHWAKFHAYHRFGDCGFSGSEFSNRFEQSARNAHGQIVFLGTSWDFCDSWTLALVGQYGWWRTSGGNQSFKTDEFCNDCGTTEVVSKTKLKSVTWDSGSIFLNLGYVF